MVGQLVLSVRPPTTFSTVTKPSDLQNQGALALSSLNAKQKRVKKRIKCLREGEEMSRHLSDVGRGKKKV